MSLTFFVAGEPKPKGSMRAFVPRNSKRVVVVNDNASTKTWQQSVTQFAKLAMGEGEPFNGPLRVDLNFVLRRAKSNHDPLPVKKQDLDKLVRAVFDGLTGVVFNDDGQVTDVRACKRYGECSGVYITVRAI